MGPRVSCYCEECKYRDEDGDCSKDWITISDEDMTAAGFLPICKDYEEKKNAAPAAGPADNNTLMSGA